MRNTSRAYLPVLNCLKEKFARMNAVREHRTKVLESELNAPHSIPQSAEFERHTEEGSEKNGLRHRDAFVDCRALESLAR